MRNWSIVLTLTLLFSCGDGALQLVEGPATVQTAALEEDEVFYIRNGEGILTLAPTASFEHIEFHFALAEVEIRALNETGGVVTEWADISGFTEDTDPSAYEGLIDLGVPASSIELRMHTHVDFARVVVGKGDAGGHEGEVDVPEGGVSVQLARPGRWMPPPHVVAAGNRQYLPYTGAPNRCTGSFLGGTRALAEQLKNNFVGAVSYGGYNCRANTANASELSVHASGRAIDLFVPLSGTQADNDLGDPIAHYLIENAQRLGIEFIVWDRASWGAHRAAPKHRAYNGRHPHHDHLHIELAPWAAGGGVSLDRSPIGYLDAANCDGMAGWAQDPDAPQNSIEVYLSIGGPVFTEGAVGYRPVASEHRQDLCAHLGSCTHGWYAKVPHVLMDGVARPVYAYGMDVTGGQSAQLRNAPKTLRCDPPRLPYPPARAIRRHIPNPDAFNAWGFDWNDIIRVDDAVLRSYTEGAKLPQGPTLFSDGATVFVVEGTMKRHVPNPRAMNAWGLDWGAIRPENTGALTTGPPLEHRPYIIRGSQPGAYLLWPK